jgi:hypothetical protein
MTLASRPTTRAKLHKPNEILVMVPRTGRLTVVGRKLYNVLLHHSQAALQRKIPGATDYFEAPLKALLEPVGTGDSDYRALAKRYLVEMQDVTMEWDSPEASAGTDWKRLKLLSEVELVKRSGEVWVRWALPPTLVNGLADPLRWTSLELSVLAKLTTYAAVALYEICARYKNNPSGVTSRKATAWWIDALSNSPAAIDPDNGEPKRREWRKFKNEFVLPAIAQVNMETDLELELLEFKQGRAVAEVQLAVRKKAEPPRALPAPVNAGLLAQANKAGISEREIDELLTKWTSTQLQEALTKLAQRHAISGIEEVRSPLGYLRHLLGKPEASMNPEAGKPSAPVSAIITPSTSRGMFMEEGAGGAAASGDASSRDRIVAVLTELPPQEQRKLLSVVAESLKARGLLTPSIARRVGQGDWQAAGLLRSEMFQLYSSRHPDAASASVETSA